MRVTLCLVTLISVFAAVAATGAGANVGSSCKNIRTFQQAVQAGVLPAIVAALHGGEPIINPLLCNT